jgi:protein SHQ1
VEASEDESCEWNAVDNCYKLKVLKKVPGEHFEGLEMITRLLAIPSATNKPKQQLIEVISSEARQESDQSEDDEDDLYDEHETLDDFYVEQRPAEISVSTHKYGFNQMHSGVLERFGDELWQLIDLPTPGQIGPAERIERRLAQEQLDFDDEHYLSDLYDNVDTINRLIEYEAACVQRPEDHQRFTDEETFCLKNLPRREYCLDRFERRSAMYGLIDVLFAYAFDRRVNEGDECAESAWNICKLSCTLSWFERFDRLDDVIVACMRRALCYPVFRHFDLGRQALRDVSCLLSTGPVAVIKAMLYVRNTLNEYGDFRYLLNDLYIVDYCVWLQSVARRHFDQLVTLLDERIERLDKQSLRLDLDVVERAAEQIVQEELELKMQRIRLD